MLIILDMKNMNSILGLLTFIRLNLLSILQILWQRISLLLVISYKYLLFLNSFENILFEFFLNFEKFLKELKT
jgi:hypothetical protein